MPDQNIIIVIPTYNEAENLENLVSALFLKGTPNLRLLIADDNSPDGTGKIADRLAEEHPGRVSVLHRPKKQGLGKAYLHGFAVAMEMGATAIGQMDADFSHPPEKWKEMSQALEHADIVIGSRYVQNGSVDKEWPLWRKWLSAFGNLYARTILHLPVRDVTGGFRLFRREMLESMPLELVQSNGYIFQVEMAYLAHLCGARFTEVPIYFADRKFGTSKMSFAIQREAAIRVWRVRWHYRKFRNANAGR